MGHPSGFPDGNYNPVLAQKKLTQKDKKKQFVKGISKYTLIKTFQKDNKSWLWMQRSYKDEKKEGKPFRNIREKTNSVKTFIQKKCNECIIIILNIT